MPSTKAWLLDSGARFQMALRLSLLIVIVEMVGIALVCLVSFVSPTKAIATPKLQHLNVGSEAKFEVGKPVSFETGDFWLVKQPDGTFLALYARDTKLSDFGSGGVRCPVKYLPDFAMQDPVTRQDVKGFKANCSGSDFRLDGSRLFGPSPRGLDRRPVWVSASGDVIVNIDDAQIQAGH